MRIPLVIALCAAAIVSARAEEPAKPASTPADVTVNMGALPTPMPRHKPAPEEMRPPSVPMPRPKPDQASLAATVPMPRPKPELALAEVKPPKPPKAPVIGTEALPAPAAPMTSPQGAATIASELRGSTSAAAAAATRPVDPTAGFSVLTRVQFKSGQTVLADDAKAALDALAARLVANEERVRLAAFSGAPGDTSSDARRLSLERALAVRTYLESKGVPASRVDLLVFGGSTSGAPDRVDVLIRPA